ncbi:hypothetical protein scyTo_0017149 [Scyliorhinus torazame]|uniref:Uncharacterized protein n=1 Tax=Scyliorhinus torazame TaxID=75743 RepID=A0A401Q4P4_SCYTO|nr:hypothetical protein [Scyliorhinus torazame]
MFVGSLRLTGQQSHVFLDFTSPVSPSLLVKYGYLAVIHKALIQFEVSVTKHRWISSVNIGAWIVTLAETSRPSMDRGSSRIKAPHLKKKPQQ